MRTFSFRPSLTVRGREFRGLRGFAGKPFHPPLTDLPVAAYLFAAVFDAISYFGDAAWSRDFYRAASFVLIGGAAVSVLAALTGFWDWLRSTEKGTQVRRTVNAHAWTMVIVTVIVLVDIAIRYFDAWDATATPVVPLVLSVAALVLVTLGGMIGGSLVYDYGFNVENSTDHPAYHVSERDVLPHEKT